MNYSNVRARQNSDGFCELSNNPADQEETKVEAKPQIAAENDPSNQSQTSSQGPNIELPMMIEIETDYILTSHLGDWQKLYNEYTFTAD